MKNMTDILFGKRNLRKGFAAMSAGLLLLSGALSCGRVEAPGVEAPEVCTLSVRALVDGESPITKAGNQTSAEASVSTLDVLVFLPGGALAEQKRFTASEEAELTLAKGLYRICVLANLPAAPAVSSVSALESLVTPFSYNGVSSFVMSAPLQSVTLAGDMTVDFDLKRLCSKIELEGSATVDMSAYPDITSAVIVSAFVINIPTNVGTLDASVSGSTWVNERDVVRTGGVVDSSVLPTTYRNNPTAGSTMGSFSLYCYPNVAAEAASKSEEDMVTKLVIACDYDGTTVFYPIGIPDAGRNKRYAITNIVISDRNGSQEPNKYDSGEEGVSFNLNVTDWVTVSDWADAGSGTVSGGKVVI